MDVMDKIKEQVTSNPIILYMKGTPQLPQCGFSSRTVQALKQCGQPFAYVNVFMDNDARRALPNFSDWPTFPQLFIEGQLVGGCDIVMDLFESGELQKLIDGVVVHPKETQ